MAPDVLYSMFICSPFIVSAVTVWHIRTLRKMEMQHWTKLLLTAGSATAFASTLFLFLLFLFVQAKEKNSGCYNRLNTVLAVLVSIGFAMSHAMHVWLWTSVAAFHETTVRLKSNLPGNVTLSISQRCARRRLFKTFIAVLLIFLPISLAHNVVKVSRSTWTMYSCYAVEPSAFGQLMGGLSLQMAYWNYFSTMLLVPCAALAVFATKLCWGALKVVNQSARGRPPPTLQLTTHLAPSLPATTLLTVYFALVIMHLPILHTVLSASADTTLFNIVTENSRFSVIFISCQFMYALQPVHFVSFCAQYRRCVFGDCLCKGWSSTVAERSRLIQSNA